MVAEKRARECLLSRTRGCCSRVTGFSHILWNKTNAVLTCRVEVGTLRAQVRIGLQLWMQGAMEERKGNWRAGNLCSPQLPWHYSNWHRYKEVYWFAAMIIALGMFITECSLLLEIWMAKDCVKMKAYSMVHFTDNNEMSMLRHCKIWMIKI